MVASIVYGKGKILMPMIAGLDNEDISTHGLKKQIK
jgi:hypothetical protein